MEKWAKNMNRQVIEEEIQMDYNMERYIITFLVIRIMQTMKRI